MRGAWLPAVLAAVVGIAPGSASGVGETTHPRVVVMILDGADGNVVAELLDRGVMPQLAAVAAGGAGLALLIPPIPASSEASWAALTTGMDPGTAGVVGRWRRLAGDGSVVGAFGSLEDSPDGGWWRPSRFAGLALAAVVVSLVAFSRRRQRRAWGVLGVAFGLFGLTALAGIWWPRGSVIIHRQPTPAPFWEVAGAAGVAAAAAHVPGRWPVVGAPGVRELARWEGERPGLDGRAAVRMTRKGTELAWHSPLEPSTRRPLRASLELGTLGREEPGGTTADAWGGSWQLVVFRGFPLRRIAGWVRLQPDGQGDCGVQARPRVVPHPGWMPEPLALSAPREWAVEAAARLGPAVAGWTLDRELVRPGTGAVDLEALQGVLQEGAAWSRRVAAEALAGAERLVVVSVPLPGTATGVWGGAWDMRHPLYRTPEGSSSRAALRAAYEAADTVVGAVRRRLAEEDVLLVVSPHGAARWDRTLDLDAWLAQEGLLGLLPEALPADRGGPLSGVDWNATCAYTLGEAALWLNIRSRDPQGTIHAGMAAERLRRRVAARLEALVDPVTGRRPVARVWLQEEIFRRAAAGAPDLVVTTASGFGVGNLHGGFLSAAPEPFAAGSHWALPERVPGLVVSSRPLRRRHLEVVDLAPTVLSLLGVPVPPELMGQAFL